MNNIEINQLIYKKSYDFLLSILPSGITENDLKPYFESEYQGCYSISSLFERLIGSAQNYQSMPNIIKFDTRKNKIKKILHNYDLKWIASLTTEELFNIFYAEKDFEIKIVNKNIKFNSWHKWSHSIIDSAKFLLSFKDINEFKGFVEQFDYNLPMRTALPLLLSTKISGIGFALSCDFLKELGYTDYVKPDTHIIDICCELGLSEDRNQIRVFEAMIRLAEDCKKIDNSLTPYKLDKIFWLICSGSYYFHDITTKRYKKELIKMLKDEIQNYKISV